MRVKESLTDIGICLGYFATGFCYLAIYQNIEGTIVKSAVELLSFIATIAAAIFAVYALSAWKTQFSHSEGFSALTKLMRVVDDLLIAGVYVRGCVQYERAKHLADDDPMKLKWKQEEDQALNQWRDAYANFCLILQDVTLFVKKDSLHGYLANPRDLWARFEDITIEVKALDSGSDMANGGAAYFKALLRSKAFETELVRLKESVQALRSQLVQ